MAVTYIALAHPYHLRFCFTMRWTWSWLQVSLAFAMNVSHMEMEATCDTFPKSCGLIVAPLRFQSFLWKVQVQSDTMRLLTTSKESRTPSYFCWKFMDIFMEDQTRIDLHKSLSEHAISKYLKIFHFMRLGEVDWLGDGRVSKGKPTGKAYMRKAQSSDIANELPDQFVLRLLSDSDPHLQRRVLFRWFWMVLVSLSADLLLYNMHMSCLHKI